MFLLLLFRPFKLFLTVRLILGDGLLGPQSSVFIRRKIPVILLFAVSRTLVPLFRLFLINRVILLFVRQTKMSPLVIMVPGLLFVIMLIIFPRRRRRVRSIGRIMNWWSSLWGHLVAILIGVG